MGGRERTPSIAGCSDFGKEYGSATSNLPLHLVRRGGRLADAADTHIGHTMREVQNNAEKSGSVNALFMLLVELRSSSPCCPLRFLFSVLIRRERICDDVVRSAGLDRRIATRRQQDKLATRGGG